MTNDAIAVAAITCYSFRRFLSLRLALSHYLLLVISQVASIIKKNNYKLETMFEIEIDMSKTVTTVLIFKFNRCYFNN